jgi:hypothetical protein
MVRSRVATLAAVVTLSLAVAAPSPAEADIVSFFKQIGAAIATTTTSAWSAVSGFTKSTVSNVYSKMKSSFTSAISAVKTAYNAVQEKFSSLTSAAKTWLVTKGKTILTNYKNAFEKLYKCVAGLVANSTTLSAATSLVSLLASKKIGTTDASTQSAKITSSSSWTTCKSITSQFSKLKSFTLGLAFSGSPFPVIGIELGGGFALNLSSTPNLKGWVSGGMTGGFTTSGVAAGVQGAFWTGQSGALKGWYLAVELAFTTSANKLLGVQVYFAPPTNASDWAALLTTADFSKYFTFMGVGLSYSVTPSASFSANVAGGFTWDLPPYDFDQF